MTDIDQNMKEWKLPEPKISKFEFLNSAGLRYEAEEIRRCFNEGLTECPVVTQQESLIIARIEDEVRRQIGVKFAEDD